MSNKQQHEVHRGTILSLLHHGGFIQRDKRWFAAPDGLAAQRVLRVTLSQTSLPQTEAAGKEPYNAIVAIRTRAQIIKQRLEEISHLSLIVADQEP